MVTLWAERLLHVLHSLARFCLIAFVMLFLVSLVWEYSASTPGDRFPGRFGRSGYWGWPSASGSWSSDAPRRSFS